MHGQQQANNPAMMQPLRATQSNSVQAMRTQQIKQMMGYYQVQYCGKLDNHEKFLVPFQLPISAKPLYVSVDVPFAFPTAKPIVLVNSHVIHDEINAQTKVYIGKAIVEWQEHSNLLALLRSVHNSFLQKPPIPERAMNPDEVARLKAAASGQQMQLQANNNNQSRNSFMDAPMMEQQQQSVHPVLQKEQTSLVSNLQVDISDQMPSEQDSSQAPVKRSDQELQQAAEKMIDSKLGKKLQAQEIMTMIQSMDVDEVRYLANNDEYKKDTILQSPQIIQYRSKVDALEDEGYKLAKTNEKKHDQLDEARIKHEDLKYEFDELAEQVNQLVSQFQEKQDKMHPKILAEAFKQPMNDIYKETEKLQKGYKKGEVAAEDYIKEFVKARQKYYQYDGMKQALLAKAK